MILQNAWTPRSPVGSMIYDQVHRIHINREITILTQWTSNLSRVLIHNKLQIHIPMSIHKQLHRLFFLREYLSLNLQLNIL